MEGRGRMFGILDDPPYKVRPGGTVTEATISVFFTRFSPVRQTPLQESGKKLTNSSKIFI